MVSLLAHAQNIVYTLLSLMPSTYQQKNLEAMFGMFLEAQGYPLPQHSKSKSASALSRFLNIYNWSTRGVIRTARNRIPRGDFVRAFVRAPTIFTGYY